MAKNTAYDGVELLDGSFGNRDVVIEGTGDSETINIELSDLTLDGLKLSAHTVTLEAGDDRIGQDDGQGGTYVEGDEILISTNKGRVIRVAVKEIRIAGRNTKGVRIIKLSGDEKVVSATKIDDNLL